MTKTFFWPRGPQKCAHLAPWGALVVPKAQIEEPWKFQNPKFWNLKFLETEIFGIENFRVENFEPGIFWKMKLFALKVFWKRNETSWKNWNLKFLALKISKFKILNQENFGRWKFLPWKVSEREIKLPEILGTGIFWIQNCKYKIQNYKLQIDSLIPNYSLQP